jgi:hypothetical protein
MFNMFKTFKPPPVSSPASWGRNIDGGLSGAQQWNGLNDLNDWNVWNEGF